ncbi:MAG: polymerase sigma-70 factor, subfamily [Actinomycetota bacterium]|jgi:RNA polymerase sigma-70 factor (ECF subfamily)|nr:polymerase sigma-70 factor, subfamily [Actinomycetota bacterium]
MAAAGEPRSEFGEAFDALLAAARSGAPWAWDRVYRWLSPAVAGYLRVQGVTDVDDVTSEAFLGVVRNIGRFRGDERQFRSWVFVIAHHKLQDHRRQRARRPEPGELVDNGAMVGGDAEDDALRSIATARVHELCARLAPDQRDVILLRIVGDLTVDDVAAALGKSSGAVKALQRRAFEALRKIFEQEGVPL